MAVVRPHGQLRCLRSRVAEMMRQRIESIGHMTIAEIPRGNAAARSGAVIRLAVHHHARTLPRGHLALVTRTMAALPFKTRAELVELRRCIFRARTGASKR